MPAHAKPQRPTQRTIAEQAGVSVGAVSRALANDPQMAEDTRQLIQKIAAEVGYTPDRAAQRLRTGRTQVIGLILPPHEEILGFGTSLIKGISTTLTDTQYHLVVMPDFGYEQSDALIRRVVRNGLADGIIFSRTEPGDRRIKYLLEEGFPFICHGRSELATPHAFVDFDNYEFTRLATQRLVAEGARHLAILLPHKRFMFRHHLHHGFMATVRETGVRHEILAGITLDDPPDRVEAAIRKRFRAAQRPDGLILPGEVSGLAALAAIQDLGMTPGEDVRLVVKQTTGLFDMVRPRVTSLYEDLTEAGEQLAALLLRRIAGEPPGQLQYLQPVTGLPAG